MWGRKKKNAGEDFTPLKDAGGDSGPAAPAVPHLAPASHGPAAPSLKELVKMRILTDMIRGFPIDDMGAIILVDKMTVRILSSAYKMSELLEENIHLVENITNKDANGSYLQRQPMPTVTACYFVTPTVESINRMIADYKDKRSPMYNKCHIFLSGRLSDALLAKVKTSNLIKYVQTFKELNLEYVLQEDNCFLLDSPQSLPLLFAPEESAAAAESKRQEQHRLANMLVTLCATLGEMPHVRSDTRAVGTGLANTLQQKLEELARPGSSFPTRHLSDAERPTLLILDRSHDPMSPLLHEYTYQAMINDLLNVQDDRYKYSYTGNNNQVITKEVLLNDTDPLYKKLKHMHIAELSTHLHAEYKQFLESNKQSAALSKGQAGDMKAMTEGIKSMPKFQEETARYSLHIHVVGELLKKFTECHLEELSMLEQAMATGDDSAQKPYKSALADLRALLGRADLPTSPEDRIRLLMQFVISQDGIKQEQRRELMELAAISPEDQVGILNLFYLGVTLLQGTAVKKKKADKKKGADQGYDVSRYVPPLKRILEDAVAGSLSPADFPYVTPPREMGKQARAPSAGGEPGRLVVFVVGGLAYSELRVMHEVAKATGRDIIVGSTAMLTPQRFLIGLKNLKQLEVAGV